MLKNKESFKKIITGGLLAAMMTVGTIAPFAPTQKVYAAEEQKAKNVIMLIPDGMSVEEQTFARWYYDLLKDGIAGNDVLTLDTINTGLVRTHWANGPITDSAAAGTALATGHKADGGNVGVLGAENENKPVANVLEAARLSGKAVGVVSTSEVMHATPATFSAHDSYRKDYNSLMKQMVYNNIDVVFGGGDKIISGELTKYREDGVDLREELKANGYGYITSKDELETFNGDKVWGMFADKAMSYDLDRPEDEPSLAEMTDKAIQILSKDEDGFFLMVEGSEIDWAGHANDPSGILGDTIAFDKAVKVALDFAKEDGNTVIVSCADHGTGGMTVGYDNIGAEIDKSYSTVEFDQYVEKTVNTKFTASKANSELKDAEEAVIKEYFKSNFGIENLTEEQVGTIKEGKASKVLSKIYGVGWTSTGHVGGDVALYNYAPEGVEKLTGVVDNTEVAKYMARIMDVDLDETTDKLFQRADEAFEKIGANLEVDTTDAENPVLVATKDGHTMKLFGFTNKIEFDGAKDTLETLIVFVDNKADCAYIPQEAITKFEAFVKAGKVVEIEAKKGIVTAKSGLNVREKANGNKIGALLNGTEVEIVSEEGNWYKIKFNNSTAYVHSKYISIN